MNAERHNFVIRSLAPPVVEFDSETPAIYVRFKKGQVAKTVPLPCEIGHLAIDVDSKGEVIGLEAVGMDEFSMQSLQLILKNAPVEASSVDFSKTRFVPANLVPA